MVRLFVEPFGPTARGGRRSGVGTKRGSVFGAGHMLRVKFTNRACFRQLSKPLYFHFLFYFYIFLRSIFIVLH